MSKINNKIYGFVAICMVAMVVCFTFIQERDDNPEHSIKQDEDRIIISFNGDEEIIQSFFGTVETIEKLGVEFSPQLREVSLAVTVYDNDAKIYYQNPDCKVKDAVTIQLDKPVTEALGHEFYIRFQPSGNIVSFFATQDKYPDNHLLVEGKEKTEDIILIQYDADDTGN